MLRYLPLLLIAVLLGGCAYLQPAPPPAEPVADDSRFRGGQRWLSDEVIEAQRRAQPVALVTPEFRHTDPISEALEQMAEQLAVGLDDQRVSRLPVAVLPFRQLERRTSVGLLGERLSESIIFQMQQLGFNLVDHRAISLTTTAKMDPDDETLSLLRSRNRIYFIITGTYASYPDGVVINARVLDTTTRQVVATGQTHVPRERLEGRWPGYDPLEAQRRGMIIENRRGPASGW